MRDPWRYACPNGHSSWTPTTDGYTCKICGREFDELRDLKNEDIARPVNNGRRGGKA